MASDLASLLRQLAQNKTEEQNRRESYRELRPQSFIVLTSQLSVALAPILFCPVLRQLPQEIGQVIRHGRLVH